MKRRELIATAGAVFIATLGCLGNASTALDVSPRLVYRMEMPIAALYPGFQNPPTETRPFARWCNGNKIKTVELARESEGMARMLGTYD
ncbi:hypothetical protein ACFL6U_06785 [Planctomycetota bacterium]